MAGLVDFARFLVFRVRTVSGGSGASTFYCNWFPMARNKPPGNGKCAVCRHPDRWRLELLRAGGAGIDALAAKFGVSRDCVHRHWLLHVTPEMKAGYLCGPAELATLAERAAIEGDSVLDHLRLCRTVLTGQLANMTEAADARGAAYVAGQLTRTLEAIARVTGEIGELARSTVNIHGNVILTDSPAFARVQATLLRALAAHPGARADVVRALRDLDQEAGQAGAAAKVIDHLPAIGGDHVAA
jgi:hypothetical protein